MASVNRVDLGEATLTGRLPIGAGQPRVVSWLPNETLFSLASRHHHIAGNSTPDQTCLQLFGDKRIGCSHDFPAGLRHFVAQTEGLLGSSTEITLQHSLLPFYLAFHPEYRCTNWLTNIEDGSAYLLKAELGILASRFGASHPLKACALCMCEDSRLHHVAYWHVQHQLPGVWVCPVHRCALQIATMKWRGHNRFGWLLPTQTEWVVPQAEPNTEHLPAFLAMASGAIALWSLPPSFQFDAGRMRSSYRVGMHISGCLSSGNRVDHQTFEKIVQSVVSPLLGLQEFSALTQDVAKTKTRFLRYLCAGSPRDGRHPLNHLVLAVALFGSWERFWEVYQSQNESSGEIASTAGLEPIARAPTTAATDQRKAQFLLLLDPGNQSVSAVAAQVGIAVGTAMAWAAAHGLENQRRPKTLKADRRIALIADLKRGSDKLVAANNAGVSVQTVTRLLFTESGLHDAWQQRRFTQAQSAARKLWKSTIEDFPESSSVGWRKLQPASYAWLYRNDRAWLEQSVQARDQPCPKRRSIVQWGARDAALALQIRISAIDWLNRHPTDRLTIAALSVVIPTLKARLSSLHKLPLTRKALTEISGRKLRKKSSEDLWSD